MTAPKRRWFRFSLRGLLVLMTLVAVATGFLVEYPLETVRVLGWAVAAGSIALAALVVVAIYRVIKRLFTKRSTRRQYHTYRTRPLS